MRPTRQNHSRHLGVILTEACVSLMLAGLVLATVSLMLTRYARSTDYYLNYRRVQLAAESCVERMRAGAVEIADATFTDEANVTYEIRVSDAPDAWKPLEHVTVTASVLGKHNRPARYKIDTYLQRQHNATEGHR